jgi:hypothetical protein
MVELDAGLTFCAFRFTALAILKSMDPSSTKSRPMLVDTRIVFLIC